MKSGSTSGTTPSRSRGVTTRQDDHSHSTESDETADLSPGSPEPSVGRFLSTVSSPHAELQRARDALTNATKLGYTRGTAYIPIDELVNILNEKAVAAMLPACLGGSKLQQFDYGQLSRTICGRNSKRESEKGDEVAYDRILAILILMSKSNQLKQFLDNKINNGDLPLVQVGGTRLCSARDKEQPLKFLELVGQGWDLADRLELYKSQLKVLAPVFAPRVHGQTASHYSVPYLRPLPFEEIRSRNPPMAGHYSEVKRVEIHSAHNRFRHLVGIHPD